jgi:hypothetical protein
MIGCVLMALMPGVTARVRRQPFVHNWGPIGRLIRNGLQFTAVARRDHDLLEDFLADYWNSPVSREFFDHFRHRFETLFLAHHRGIVDEIGRAVDLCQMPRSRVVEVGVGDARVLEYLGDHLPRVDEFHGIDLNQKVVEENRNRFAGMNGYWFHTEDVGDWLAAHPAPGTVLFTNGGVFEYFRRSRLDELFRALLASGAPCMVAMTETIAVDHDLEGDPESHPYGHEFSFSHNYPAILHEAGFEVLFIRDRFTAEGEEHHPARWLQVVARAV